MSEIHLSLKSDENHVQSLRMLYLPFDGLRSVDGGVLFTSEFKKSEQVQSPSSRPHDEHRTGVSPGPDVDTEISLF